MTRYTVVWRSIAEDEVTVLWCNHEDRQSITRAADEIDAELAKDASQKGVAFTEHLRLLRIPPLLAYFTVDEGDRKATVLLIELTD